MDIDRRSGQSVRVDRLREPAVWVRRVGLVAELVLGRANPVPAVRPLSPVLVKVTSGDDCDWWFPIATDTDPIAPVDEPASATRHIHGRTRDRRSAMGWLR
jgi:hypothetical protein